MLSSNFNDTRSTLYETNSKTIKDPSRGVSAKVKSEWKGTTFYGFPSTLQQGKTDVKHFKDNDPTTENENLISKQNYMQSAIK